MFDELFYPYQQKFYKSESQYRVIEKARQIGYSFTIAFECAINAIRGKHSLVISTGMRASERVNDMAKQWVYSLNKHLGFKPIKFRKETQSELVLDNGGQILSLPASLTAVRGFTGDNLYIDEAAHIKNARAVLQAVAPALTRKDKFRRLTVVSTHFGKKGLFWDVCNNHSGIYSGFEKHSVTIYQAIKEGFPGDIKTCLTLLGVKDENDPAFLQEYCCKAIDEVSAYFTFEIIQAVINYDLENETMETMAAERKNYYSGYDPAKVVDSGVFCIVEKTENNSIIIKHIKEWQKINYSEQLAYIETFCKATKVLKANTDKTGVGQKIDEDLSKSLGNVSQGVTFTNTIKEKMIVTLHNLFVDKKIEIPNHPKLLHQLHNLQRVIGNNIIKYHHTEGEHDDYVWALALAVFAAFDNDTSGLLNFYSSQTKSEEDK